MRQLSSFRSEGTLTVLARPKSAIGRVITIVALIVAALASVARAQIVRGTVSSAIAGGRVTGAVVLLLDSNLTAHARDLTSDSGAFIVAPGAPGRYHLRVMRLGFKPTETSVFDLRGDTTVATTLTDIPVALPTVAVRDRNECRRQTDTTAAGLATFALWDQARTALFAAAITLEEREYRFTKFLHIRVYDMRKHDLSDIEVHNAESEGTAPWVSLTPDQLRQNGYVTEDDAGMTFYAPDLDVLLSPYFAEAHCFHLTSDPAAAPDSGEIGLDFEPATKPRHVEIRGTLWLDSATTALRTLRFTFVNLPISRVPDDTLLGGRVDFARLSTGAWILPSWSIRMPTPVRSRRYYSAFSGSLPVGGGRSHWDLTADQIRVSGGDLRAVRRNDSTSTVIWEHATGTVRMLAVMAQTPDTPATAAIVRLVGSPYQGHTDAGGHVRFEQVMPGTYLFEATTPLHDVIEAPLPRVAVTARAGAVVDAKVTFEPLPVAAAAACQVRKLDRGTAILAGAASLGDSTPAAKARVTVDWPDGEQHTDTRADGWFRLCGIPTGKLLMIKAERDGALATRAITLDSTEIVHPLTLRLTR